MDSLVRLGGRHALLAQTLDGVAPDLGGSLLQGVALQALVERARLLSGQLLQVGQVNAYVLLKGDRERVQRVGLHVGSHQTATIVTMLNPRTCWNWNRRARR